MTRIPPQEAEDLYNAEVALKDERELLAQQAVAAEEARMSEEVRRKRAASAIQVSKC